jgi:cytochrome b6-f complex iron-sulfur subunit
MSATAIIAIAVAVVVVLGALAFLTLARRSDVRGAGALSAETVRRDRTARAERADAAEVSMSSAPTAREVEAAGVRARTGTSTAVEPAADRAPVEWSPPDPEALGVSRRQFLNRATVSLMGAGIGAFAAASFVGFLWPTATGGFGSRVTVGRLDDIFTGIDAGGGFFYSSEARTWITRYPAEALSTAQEVYDPQLLAGLSAGIIANYQKCPHLGCRVPECLSSQWFECGCHGSQYSRVGEYKGGPAPRGMDRFPIEISPAGDVTVDTGTIVPGTAIGVDTTGQEAEGPNCMGEVDH